MALTPICQNTPTCHLAATVYVCGPFSVTFNYVHMYKQLYILASIILSNKNPQTCKWIPKRYFVV